MSDQLPNKRRLDYDTMQRVADEISEQYGIKSDLGAMHIRVVKQGETDRCKNTSHLLSDAVCGPWELLKVDDVNGRVRDNHTPFKLQGKEKENKRLLGQVMIEELKTLKEEPSACGNPERMLSTIFLGAKSESVLSDISRCYLEDLETMSRESLPWHKVYQDYMYMPTEFFRNTAYVSTWLNNSGIRYLLEEMRCLSGEEIVAETTEEFWFMLIKKAMQFRRNVLTNKGDCEKAYWFWSTMVNLQQGLLADYYPDKVPTPSFSGISSLKEVAVIHLKARSFVSLQNRGAQTVKMLSLNAEMWNTLVRTESIPVAEGRLIVLCHPARPITDASGKLPIPKYAAVTVDFSSRGFQGKLLFQNEFVNRDGFPLNSKGEEKDEYWELLEVSADAVRDVLLEREDILTFLSISGKEVNRKLIAEYCRYLREEGVDETALEMMIAKTTLGAFGKVVHDAIGALKSIFRDVQGQRPSGITIERNADDTSVEHADMDELAKKWRGVRQLLDGAVQISRPTGTEWNEKVSDEWKGEIDGKWVTVRLHKLSGKMYSDEGRFWRRIKSKDVTGTFEVNVGFSKFGFSGMPMFQMPEVDPLPYLVSGSDRKLARMALYAAEKQEILCSNESACYLLRATGSEGRRARIHTASITADVLNGMDMYYDRKNGLLFVKFLSRFMELSKASGARMFHLTEVPGVDRSSLYLANAEIIGRGYKLAGCVNS